MATQNAVNFKLAITLTERLFNSKFASDGVVPLTNPAGKLTRAGSLWALQMKANGITVTDHRSALAAMVDLDRESKHAVTFDARDTSKGIRAMSLATLKGIAKAEKKAAEDAKRTREEARAAADLAEMEQGEALRSIAALAEV